jgi:hypothetical protein
MGPLVPLGTPVTWTATVFRPSPRTLAYRFQIRQSGGDFRTVVDYGPKSALTWSTIDQEGSYQIEVSVQNYDTGEQLGISFLPCFPKNAVLLVIRQRPSNHESLDSAASFMTGAPGHQRL